MANKLLISLLGFLAAPICGTPIIVAHRGASHVAPENTLASMRQAVAERADVWELDVHLSYDNRLIVIHDKTTLRTTGTSITIAQAEAQDIRHLDAGIWKGAAFTGEKLPFLEEVIEVLPANTGVFIEIKSGPETVGPVSKALKVSGKESQCTIIGFDLETMMLAKLQMPRLRVMWLRSAEKDAKTGKVKPFPEHLIQLAKRAGLDGLDLQHTAIEPPLVKAAHEIGLQLHAWTVDDPAEARRLADIGVDSVTTNRPAYIRAALDGETSGSK